MPTLCANGKHCASARALGGPSRLSLSNVENICHSCQEHRRDAHLPSDSEPSEARTYSLTEAADLLGVPRSRVRYLVRSGQLRASKAAKGARAVWTIVQADLRALEGAS